MWRRSISCCARSTKKTTVGSSTRTIRNALRRTGAGTPVELHPDDFEIERMEHLTRTSTVLMLDLSMSMPMRDNFLPAKKVAMALHSLISSQFPRDYLGIVGFSEVARELKPEQLPEVSWDFVYGTNMQHGFQIARRLLSRQTGTKQIIMITDGEPTAHIEGGEVSRIRFKRAIIATGSRINEIPPAYDLPVWSSAEALEIPEIPENLLVEIGRAHV